MSQSAAIQLVNMLGAQGNQSAQMAQQLQKLEDSCKDFESVFTTKLLEVMRKTVPQDGIINGGRAEEIFTGLMNEEIAKNIADTGQMGLANMMFSQLKQQLFGQGEVDPSMFQLGKELVKIEAENADPAAQDEMMAELLANGGNVEGGEGSGENVQQGVELTDMLAEAGVVAEDTVIEGEPVEGEAADSTVPVDGNAEETAARDNGPEQVNSADDTAGQQQAAAAAEIAEAAAAGAEAVAATQENSDSRTAQRSTAQQHAQQDAQAAAATARDASEAVQAATDAVRDAQHTQQQVDTDADAEAENSKAAADALKTQETAARKSDAEAKAAPMAEAAVADDGEAPVTETVRKDAMDRYRRADGKNETRSFAARVSEQLRSTAPQQDADVTAPAGTDADARNAQGAAADEADISLLKSEIEGKVEAAKRMEGFAVPRQTAGTGEKNIGTSADLPAAPKDTDTEVNAAAFQRMQALGTALTETEHTEMSRATVEEPAKVMNQIIRSAEVMVKEGRSEMTIELQPRHLGEVRINVVMDNDVLTARIHAKNEAVGDMIRLNLAQLGDSLKDMGFDVSHFDVSSGSDYGFGQDGSNQAGERDGQPVFTDTVSEFIDGIEPEVPEPYRYQASAGQYAFDAVA